MAITPRGLRFAGVEAASRNTPGASTYLQHGRGVSWIAAHCECRGRPWFGPVEARELGLGVKLPRQGAEAPKLHLPDLGFLFEGERWAVEFERTSKGRNRLRRILAGYRSAQLAGELGWVLYVCDTESIEELVAEVAEEVDKKAAGGARLKLTVRSLERIVREAREDCETA
jgi:hypothetical protein